MGAHGLSHNVCLCLQAGSNNRRVVDYLRPMLPINVLLLHGSTILFVPAIIFFIVGFLLLTFLAKSRSPGPGIRRSVSALFAVGFFFAGIICLLIAVDELRYWIKYSLYH